MRIWRILLALSLLSMVAGCGEKAVHATGGKTAKWYGAVASLSPGTTEIVGFKFMNIKLVGRTASCNYPVTVTSAPVVVNGVKPNYEQIIASGAEAVFYDADLFTETDLAKFKEANIDLIPLGGNTIDEFIHQLYIIGATFSGETAIMEYIGDIERAKEVAEGSKPAVAPKVAVISPDARGGHLIAGTKSLVADIVKSCGGEIVGPDSSKFEIASGEALVGWNPDLIACTPKYEWIVNDPRLQSIKAVKDFKAGKPSLAQLNPDIALRRGVRVNTLITSLSSFISGKMAKGQ